MNSPATGTVLKSCQHHQGQELQPASLARRRYEFDYPVYEKHDCYRFIQNVI